jgi:hypothetical protein
MNPTYFKPLLNKLIKIINKDTNNLITKLKQTQNIFRFLLKLSELDKEEALITSLADKF